MYKQQLGQAGEEFACQYLRKQGLKLIKKNFKCRLGEIDLIMQDKTCLVFVEVRVRNNKDYGDAAASITSYKQRRVIHAAEYYLQSQQFSSPPDCRFDVIALNRHNHSYDLQWYKDAFYTKEF